MKKLIVASILSLAVLPAPAHPQVSFQMQINLGLPPAPPLAVVQPGIQVVEGWPEQVFFTGGFYWVCRADNWYRAPNPGAAFVYVEPRYVPVDLWRIPPGKYKHYHKEHHKHWKKHKGHGKHEWHD
jgi:hypothetical protein